MDALQVWIPPSTPCIICVTDDVAKVRPFAAKFTLQCHCYSYQAVYRSRKILLRSHNTESLILTDALSPAKPGFLSCRKIAGPDFGSIRVDSAPKRILFPSLGGSIPNRNIASHLGLLIETDGVKRFGNLGSQRCMGQPPAVFDVFGKTRCSL
jgi:hypothetical protein